MTTFTVILDGARLLAGVDAALAAYNEALPPTALASDGSEPGPIADRASYIQFVLERAAESWANQHGVPATV